MNISYIKFNILNSILEYIIEYISLVEYIIIYISYIIICLFEFKRKESLLY